MLLSRRLRIVPILVAAILTITACSDGLLSPSDTSGRYGTAASAMVSRAWTAQRAALAATRGPAAYATDLRDYYAWRDALHDPARRSAAADTFLSRWSRDAGHPLWLELAVTKRTFIGRDADVAALMAQAVRTDTTTATYHFARARIDWGRDPAAVEHFRRAARTATPGSLLHVWAHLRSARTMFDAGDTDSALASVVRILPEALAVGGPLLAGSAWLDFSYMVRQAGRLGDALLAAHAADACARAAGHGFLGTRARLSIGRAHLARSEFNAACDTFAACRRVARDSSYHRWLKSAAGLLAQAARASGDPLLEQKHLEALHEATTQAADTNGIILARIALGSVERRQGRWSVATRWFARADEANAAWSGVDRAARIVRERAIMLAQQGRYAAAESLRLAARHLDAGDWSGQGAVETWLGLAWQGLDTDRPDLVYRALAEAERLDPARLPRSASYDPVLQLAEIAARLHARQGEHHLAASSLSRARERLAGASPDAAWYLAEAQGVVATEAADHARAHAAYETCERIALEIGNPDLVRRSRVRLGSVMLAEGAYAAAESLFVSDLRAPEYWTRLNAGLLIGMSRTRAGRPADALAALGTVDSLLGPDAPRDLLARLRLEQGRAFAAQRLQDRARERLEEARAACAGRRVKATTDIGRSFASGMEREISEELLALQWTTSSPASAADHMAATRALAAWGRGDTGFRETRPGPGTTRVEYFLGQRHAFVWVIPAADSEPIWRKLTAPDRLRELTTAVKIDMSVSGRSVDEAAVAELGRHLLGAAAPVWPSGATLEILPDGFLAGLPWAALQLPDPANDDPARVIERGPLVLLAGSAPPADGTAREHRGLLVLGANGHAGDDVQPALVRAEAEAQAVAEIWPGQVDLRLGGSARWSDLRAGGAAGYRVIHIASHSRIYEGAEGHSSLHIAGLGSEAPLTLPEIPNLKADAELVYLSSCESARRHQVAGWGVTTFAEAFLTAGADAIVASSVLVDDEAAAVLAEIFYRQWLTGMDKASALRMALLELQATDERWSHPFYWAFTNLYRSAT